MTDDKTPAALAADIDAARLRLTDFVTRCPAAHWLAAPVDGDPRPVGVIADHVAHAYEYLTGFITDLVAGHQVAVDSDIIDGLNAAHAEAADALSPEQVAGHLRASGEELAALVAGLEPGQLEIGDGRVRRFAVIAARHADIHRAEIEAGLTSHARPPGRAS